MNCIHSSSLLAQTAYLTSASTGLSTGLQPLVNSDLQAALQTQPLGLVGSSDPVISNVAISTQAPPPITFTVTSTADTEDPNDGVLTLREAIALANAAGDPNVINFALGAGAHTITLSGRQLAITNPAIIDGGGQITISGNNRSRIFETSSSVRLLGLTIANGSAFRAGSILNTATGHLTLTNSTIRQSNAAVGGAITNEGFLNLNNSTLHNNTAATSGGGIDNHGRLWVISSTLSGNRAGLDGGAIWNNTGSVIVQNSTITLNVADSDNDGLGNGGGILNTAGTVSVKSSIIAGNVDTPNNSGVGSIHPDVAGNFSDSGDNLIGDRTGSIGFTASPLVGTSTNRINPRLSALRDNGGYTWTHALQADSLAIDAGDRYGVFLTDQRGVQRSTPADIGAYEAAFAQFTVDTLLDADDGNFSAGNASLREAIRYINEGGIINFANDLSGTITLNSGELAINKSLTINGSGANVLTISGNNRFRVFSIARDTTVEIDGLTIANAYWHYGGDIGGSGIHNDGNLTVSNSVVRDSQSVTYIGGVIHNSANANLTLKHSTIYNNSGYGALGVIGNLGTMLMQNVTVSQNQTAPSTFGSVVNAGTLSIDSSTITGTSGISGSPLYSAIYNMYGENGVVRLKNTIVAGNAVFSDLMGQFISEGYNLIGQNSYARGFSHGQNGDQVGTTDSPIDPRLGVLQNNGGSTWTHALLAGSPALNAGNPNDRLVIDQRGMFRSARPDIGAYEEIAPTARNDSAWSRFGGRVTIPVLVNDSAIDGDTFTIVGYSNPQSGSLILNADGSFTYQHRMSLARPSSIDRFTYTISDSKGKTSTATVSIQLS
ncbi:choice-of-anchor Q domain-containing protein [Pantanalinema rosaneae CENA516]|uniref:choice-of-anchor Q domain-containing protein n=1 Tax=Pantanalinema rosaneae TaxID=1620701 RepID=UPI003D6DD25B